MSDFAPEPTESTEPQSVSEVSLADVTFEESTPEPEAPAFEAEAPAAGVPETPEPEAEADPFQDFGGRESVEAAMRLYQTAQTEDGVIQLWIEAGRTLGLTVEQMQRLWDEAPAPGAEQPEFDPDEPLTKAEWLEFQRQQQEAQQRAAWEYQQAQARAAATQTLHATIQELGLDMNDPATKDILAFGDRYFDRQNMNPENVREAVRRGHADYQAAIQRAQQQYVQQKKNTKVPSSPSGASAPSTPPPDEPQNVAEAIKRFREKFGG